MVAGIRTHYCTCYFTNWNGPFFVGYIYHVAFRGTSTEGAYMLMYSYFNFTYNITFLYYIIYITVDTEICQNLTLSVTISKIVSLLFVEFQYFYFQPYFFWSPCHCALLVQAFPLSLFHCTTSECTTILVACFIHICFKTNSFLCTN